MNLDTQDKQIEDIERAVWQARLAFGACQQENTAKADKPETHKPTFVVLP